MRFSKYIELSSSDEDVKKFRSLNIGVVKEDKEFTEIVEKIQEEYKLDQNALDIIEKANRYLDVMYSGSYKIGFCLEEEHKSKIKKIDKMKMLLFEFNDELARMKRAFERNLDK